MGAAQIEGQREIGRTLLGRHVESSRRVSVVLETRQPPGLRLKAVHRKRLVVAAAWMRDVEDAAAEGADGEAAFRRILVSCEAKKLNMD